MSTVQCACLTIALVSAAATPVPAAPAAPAAVDAPRDAVEGRWWGEVGPERDRIEAGIEFHRRDDGTLGARFTQPVLNVYGVDAGVAERDGNTVTVAPLALSLTLQGDELVGRFPGARSPARLRRVASLPGEPPLPDVPTGPGPRWTTRVGGQVYATPAIAGGRAFVGSTGGVVTAVELATGAIAWATAVDRPVFGEAAVDGDAVFVVSDGGVLHKLALADGKEAWRYDLGGADVPRVLPHPAVYLWDWQSPRPLLADGVAYVGSADGSFHAVDTTTGARRWRTAGTAMVRTGAALAGDSVVFGDHAGRVRALARADGREAWSFDTGAAVDAVPAVHDGLVVVGNRGHGLYALDAATGAERWKSHFWGSWVESGAVFVDGTIYVGSSDLRRVNAIAPEDGRPLWRTDVFGWTWGTPLVDGGLIYAGAAGGTPYFIRHLAGLSVIDRRDGRLLARWPLPDTGGHQWGIAGSPVDGGDVVVVSTIEGALLAFPKHPGQPVRDAK